MTRIAALVAQANAALTDQITKLTKAANPAGDIDTRVAAAMSAAADAITGRQNYLANASSYSAMTNEQLRQTVALLSAQLASVSELLASTRADLLVRLALDEAKLQTNFANDTLTATKLEALRLQQVADESKQASSDARLAVVEANQAIDAAALALNKALEAKDQTDISALWAATGTVGTQAAAALAKANAAQAKADADDLAVQAVQTALATAQAAANDAKTGLATLNARLKGKLVATPAVTLAVGLNKTIAVVWDTAFADANYEIQLTSQSANLVGVRVTYKDKTAAGFTLIITSVSSVLLNLAADVIDATAQHN